MDQTQREEGKAQGYDWEEWTTSSSTPRGRRRKKSGLQICYNAVTTHANSKTTNPDGKELYHTSRPRSSPKIRSARDDRKHLQCEHTPTSKPAKIAKSARQGPWSRKVHIQPGNLSRQMFESDILRRKNLLGILRAQSTGFDR